MAATKRRDKRARQFMQAAFLEDIERRMVEALGEVEGEPRQAEVVQMSEMIETKKAATPKIPYGAAIVLGTACPNCGADVAHVERSGKQFEMCTKQFDAEPSCDYARELPS